MPGFNCLHDETSENEDPSGPNFADTARNDTILRVYKHRHIPLCSVIENKRLTVGPVQLLLEMTQFYECINTDTDLSVQL